MGRERRILGEHAIPDRAALSRLIKFEERPHAPEEYGNNVPLDDWMYGDVHSAFMSINLPVKDRGEIASQSRQIVYVARLFAILHSGTCPEFIPRSRFRAYLPHGSPRSRAREVQCNS